MEISFLQRIQNSLLDKRNNLKSLIPPAPSAETSTVLETINIHAAHQRLTEIDATLEKIDSGEFGECIVCHEEVDDELLEADYSCCVCLAHFSQDEISQLEAELEFSQEIQRASLPQQAQVIPDLEMAAFTRPAQIVSGDIFEFALFKDGAQGIAIADAVGHGVSAGMLMSSVQTALRLLIPDHNSPVTVLERINRLLAHNVNFTTFATIFLGSFDPGLRQLSYCNAGHNPPLLFQSSTKKILSLAPTASALGVQVDNPFHLVTIPLLPGDALLLYTDGLTDSLNPHQEFFGLDRLSGLLANNAAAHARYIVQAIRDELDVFLGKRTPDDDTTFLVLKVK